MIPNLGRAPSVGPTRGEERKPEATKAAGFQSALDEANAAEAEPEVDVEAEAQVEAKAEAEAEPNLEVDTETKQDEESADQTESDAAAALAAALSTALAVTAKSGGEGGNENQSGDAPEIATVGASTAKPALKELAANAAEATEAEAVESEAAPAKEGSDAPTEITPEVAALNDRGLVVDTQGKLSIEAQRDAIPKPMLAAPLEHAAFEPAYEAPIRVSELTNDRAELILGEGEDRISLTVSTEGDRVHVSARTPSIQMVDTLARTSGELRDALGRQGYQLGGFDARRDQGSSRQEDEREPAHAERRSLIIKKKRIVA